MTEYATIVLEVSLEGRLLQMKLAMFWEEVASQGES